MDVDLKEVWENIPPFGVVQWFVFVVALCFLILWTLLIGFIILQICGRCAWRRLQRPVYVNLPSEIGQRFHDLDE